MNNKVTKTNILSIVGLILSILVFPVGLILCIIALVQIKKTGEKGKGFAIFGIVWASLATLFVAGFVFLLEVIIGPNIDEINRSLVCSNGPDYSSEDEDGSIVCGSVEDGKYICEFTLDGELETYTCEVEE